MNGRHGRIHQLTAITDRQPSTPDGSLIRPTNNHVHIGHSERKPALPAVTGPSGKRQTNRQEALAETVVGGKAARAF